MTQLRIVLCVLAMWSVLGCRSGSSGFPYRFDFGGDYQQVAPGFRRISRVYHSPRFLWVNPVQEGERIQNPDPLLRDFICGPRGEFWIGLPEGKYTFTFIMGDSEETRGPFSISVQGRVVAESVVVPKGQTLRQLAEGFKPNQWQAAAWQAADGEKRATRLAWRQIYLNSDLDEQNGHWPHCWLVADWPAGQADPYHVYIAWLKQPPAKGRMLRLSRGRWPIEQYFQRGKDDLGLDHYEGRGWRGFHHHLTMSAIAYLFVVVDYLHAKKNFWPDVGTGVASDAAIDRALARLLSLLSDGI